MPFLLVILLMLVCLPDAKDRSAPPAWLGLQGSILLTWFGVAAIVGTAAFLGLWTRRQLAQNPGQRSHFLHRYVSWRFYHLVGLFTVYALALFGLGWGWVVASPLTAGPLADAPGMELLVLAPFLVALVLSWACFYDVEKALHDADAGGETANTYWSRWAYLAFHVRQNLALVLVPLLLLIAAKDLPRLFPEVDEMSATIGGMLALAAGIIVLVGIVPWVLRLVLGLKPMPAGPLRSRLLAASKRLNFRCRDFLLWNTRSGIANAMLLGMLPRLRYVVFTDRLLAEMSPDEVEAVFGHEVGHVKHRHLLFYLSFFVVSFLSLNQVGKVLDLGVAWLWQSTDLAAILDLKEHKDLAFVPAVSLLGAYVFIVFGFVSRRCERQADLFGCRAVSCDQVDCLDHEGPAVPLPAGRGLCPTGIRIFMAALEKVACLNGISRDRPGWLQSWQHGTIARRVEFLENVLLDPGLEPRFQRKVWLLKWEVFLGLFGLLLLLGQLSGWAGLSVRL